MKIHHKIYNYEIGNSIKTRLNSFTVNNLQEQNKAIENYREIFNQYKNEKDFKSLFYVEKYYTKYNEEKKYTYCDYLNPVNKPLFIYLSGIWTTTKYLKRVCKKWNLNISDFKITTSKNNENIYEFFDKEFEKI